MKKRKTRFEFGMPLSSAFTQPFFLFALIAMLTAFLLPLLDFLKHFWSSLGK